ncbi:MAG TPA: COX15/CtaA family protein [Tepidisphaeraceae bacterium]|jgi:cytochrome c oxidase assembly protein subunit 15
MTDVRYNPLLHRTAQLTVAATLLLIFMGGLVTSHHAGMSVPDWPNSYGYNMFTFPVSRWVGGIFYEHTHRLMGTVVGMLSIVLTMVAWNRERRPWVRWLAASVLGAVIFQGVLGGLRVVLVKLDLAIVHACVAQAFLCLAALTAVVTSRWWIQTSTEDQQANRSFVIVSLVCTLVIYAQLVVGATMRHYEAGLAIPDFPTSYGQVLPPTDAASLAGANEQRIEMQLPPVTLSQIWLNAGHRIGALMVTGLVLATVVMGLRRNQDGAIRRPAVCLIGLLIAQITLGILTVLWRKPADIASLHVAVGALTLMTAFVLLARSIRLHRAAAPIHAEQLHGDLVPA